MAKVDLYPDFKEFLKSLNSEGVRYLLLGGYAVIHYGYRRATDDLDVWVAIEPENAARLSRVLQSFGGFPASAVKPSMFQQHGKLFKFGREPVRVDVLTGPSGVEFDTCYERRSEVVWDGIRVPLISFDDLKTNKRASGRAKDLADLAGLPPEEGMAAPKKSKKKRGRRKP